MDSIIVIGNAAIGLAVGLSLFGIVSFFAGRKAESGAASSAGRGAVYGNFVLMTVANLAMIYALRTNDFAVSYVSHVGARETPRWISTISLWSSLEGSILFWAWILAAYSAVCVYLYREKDEKFFNWVGLTLLVVQIFFYVLIALPANPFRLMDPVPANGPGPNPLLQNHWLMAVHPPCLYTGYIGFTIPFAFAVAAIMEGKKSPQPPFEKGGTEGGIFEWVSFTRRWSLFAWSFLSMAIVLGGWWSYAVLGWGGYWAWDPVENASFMPWLSATALVHSVIVQDKRKLLPVWNLVLPIVTFLLTLLGTFLTRSGIIDSVHSFTESEIGPYFLVFIGFILSASLALLLWKASTFRRPGRIENLFSLEVLFLFNNLLFLSFCFVVFLGTMYPLVVEAVRGTRISVGEPYFNQMTVPIVGMILLLMGIGLVTPWKKATSSHVLKNSRLPGLLAMIPAAVCIAVGGRKPWVVAIVYLASFAFFVMFIELVRVARRRGSFFRLFVDNPRRYGGFVAHAGALMIIVAVAISGFYGHEKEVTIRKGETADFGGYTLKLDEVRGDQAPQRFEIKAVVDVSRAGRALGLLTPQMNYYPNSAEPIGSPAVRSSPLEDLYLTLIHFEKDGSAAALRVIVTPAVVWIWIGGLIVMFGGLLALSLGRRSASPDSGEFREVEE
jgi:cytochrome c-type biogenesis protein CcmF